MKPLKDVLLIRSDLSDSNVNLSTQKILESAGYQIRTTSQEKFPPHLIVVEARTIQEAQETLETQLSDEILKKSPILVLAQELKTAQTKASVEALPSTTDSASLLRKVRNLTKETDLPKYVFQKEQRPIVQTELTLQLTEVNDALVTVNGPIKLAPQSVVQLKSTYLRNIGMREIITQRTEAPSRTLSDGRYSNLFHIFGLSLTQLIRVRKILKGKE